MEISQVKKRVRFIKSLIILSENIKDGVDILTMNIDREPADTESSLELILNTICRSFSMKPK